MEIKTTKEIVQKILYDNKIIVEKVMIIPSKKWVDCEKMEKEENCSNCRFLSRCYNTKCKYQYGSYWQPKHTPNPKSTNKTKENE